MDATAHDQEIEDEEDDCPSHTTPRVGNESHENRLIFLWCVAVQVAQCRLIEVLDNPPAHYTIETDYDKTAQDAQVGEQVILLAR